MVQRSSGGEGSCMSGRSYTKGEEPVPGYQLLKFLGRGGFGEVWKSSAPGGKQIAIKIINLGEKQGLKEFRALRMVKNLNHANLVPIFAFWLKDTTGGILGENSTDEPDSIFLKSHGVEMIIAMGLGEMSLYDRLHKCQDAGLPGIPTEELLGYMEEAAKAIDYLNGPHHQQVSGKGAIQHCDIKPQNILIAGGSAQVCDFGLARPEDSDIRKTSEGGGTYAYVAPELLFDNKPSRSTDQYSLAISYYELRCGQLPLTSTNMYEIFRAKSEGRLDFSHVPLAEQTVLKKASSVDPNERYATSIEMVRALKKAVDGGSNPSTPSMPSTPSKRPHELLRPDVEIVPGYKLIQPLGRGGYGEVWEVTKPGFGKRAALKIIANLDRIEGRQEFRALETLTNVEHDHLLELDAYWLLDGNCQVIPEDVRSRPDAPPASMLVIATKLCEKNLLTRLRECKASGEAGIPARELLTYMRQAAEAIDYLNAPRHHLGDKTVAIQHRDIKPENILLAGGKVKVGDFGLAKVLEGTSAAIHADSSGRTDAYAAPEIFSNRVTAWSDQYSLALTYVYLRAGRYPFKVSSSVEIMLVHVQGKLDLTVLPEAERPIIARATALEPEDRFPSCLAMVEALWYAVGLSAPSNPTPVPLPGAESPRKSDSGMFRSQTPSLPPSQAYPSTGSAPRSDPKPPTSRPPDTDRPPPPVVPAPEPAPTVRPHTLPAPVHDDEHDYQSIAFLQLVEDAARIPPTDQTDTSIGDAVLQETRAPEGGYPFFEPPVTTRPPKPAPVIELPPVEKAEQKWIATEPVVDLEKKTPDSLDLSVGRLEAPVQKETPGRHDWKPGTGRKQKPPDSGKSVVVAAVAVALLVVGAGAATVIWLLQRPREVASSGTRQTPQTKPIDTRESTPPTTKKQPEREKPPADSDKSRFANMLNGALANLEQNTDLEKAADQLKQVVAAGDPGTLRDANLALARVNARLTRWADAGQAVQQVNINELSGRDKANALAIIVLATDNEANAGVVLEKIIDLRNQSNSFAELGDWERAEIQKRATATVETLLSTAERTADVVQAQEAANKVLKFDDKNARALATGAELKLLIDAREPANYRTVIPAIGAELLKGPRKFRQLTRALVDIAGSDAKGSMSPILDVFKNTYSLSNLSEENRNVLRRDYAALLGKRIEPAMCDPSPNPPDFKSLQNDCEMIYKLDEHNDRHAAWLAECYVETQNQEGARDLRGHLRKDTPYPAYVSAMLARLPAFADNLSVAADDIVAVVAAQAEKPAPELKVPWRQQRAADLLTTAAIRQREEPDPSKPFKQLYPKEKADVAYRWLSKAEALAGSTPPATLQANLALTAWYKSEPDKETTRRLVAQALTQPAEALQASNTLFPLLMVRASADAEDKSNPGKALADYAQALNQVRIVKGKSQIRFDVDDLKRVLDSALDLEKSLPADDASTKSSLAQIYDFKGWLAWRFETEAYDKYAQVALDAFSRAAALDRKLPYIVYRGFARLSAGRLTRPVIDEMKADLDEAKQLDPKHRQTHFLAGYIDQNEARLETDYSKKYQLTDQAVAEFDTALKSKDDDLDRNEEVPLISFNLCSASLELGSYDANNRQTHLEKALQSVNDAEAAGYATSHLSHYAKGLVQEDLAWLCGRTQLYQAAIKSLRDAAEDRDYLSKYSMAKGRCEFKYAAFGNGGLPFLKDAIDDLNRALRKSPQKKERVETCYWLGRACALRGNFRAEKPQLNGDYLEADTDFSSGLKAFDEAALRDPTWKHLLSKAAAGLPLLEAEAIRAKKGTADIASLLEEADKRAGSLADLAAKDSWDAGKLEAARIRCAVFELNGQSSSALDAYIQAIRAYEEQSKTSKPGGLEEFYVLNVARLNCYLDAQETQTLSDQQKLNGKDVAEALEKTVAGLDAISVEPETKAIAYFAAGRAHQALAESATGADAAPTEQRLAVDDFKKALDKLPELSFRTLKWQRTLAVAYKKLVSSASTQTKEQYRKEAGDWLRQAMKNAAPAEKLYLKDILNQLQS
jgi:serine/threonine protein kinase